MTPQRFPLFFFFVNGYWMWQLELPNKRTSWFSGYHQLPSPHLHSIEIHADIHFPEIVDDVESGCYADLSTIDVPLIFQVVDGAHEHFEFIEWTFILIKIHHVAHFLKCLSTPLCPWLPSGTFHYLRGHDGDRNSASILNNMGYCWRHIEMASNLI